jgi:limonene 1,2-monooxygenase
LFEIQEARVQLGPYTHPMVEMAVAAAVSPSGPRAAGINGIGMLSMAATSGEGFDMLPAHWEVCESMAAQHDQSVDRRNWRLVAPMHLAESREQAEADMEYGLLKLVRYFERLGNEDYAYGRSLEAAIEQWTQHGLTLLGRAIIGTPDDAVEQIRSLQKRSGGFGTFLLLAHDCADPERTAKSYDLFARYVIPELRAANRGRQESLDWFSANSERVVGDLRAAIGKAIEEHEEERSESGGVAWGDTRDLLVGDD